MQIQNTMELSKEQQLAFDKYQEGKNIFITGPGGSGKSELIRRIYRHANQNQKTIHCCALTGCAAVLLNCNAKTLHSWSGVGLCNTEPDAILTKIRKNKHSLKLWKTTDVLIVDEVSMMSLKMFETLDQIGKAIRRNNKPFGGIHLIFSGDFFQLPPVGDIETCRFCFESSLWNQTFEHQIQLIKIFRQKDEEYASILNQVREGRIKKSANARLESCVGRVRAEDGIVITKLFPTRQKVDLLNRERMDELNGDELEFKMKLRSDLEGSGGSRRAQFSAKDVEYELLNLSKNLLCDQELKLKLGAQVMCVVNIASEKGGSLDICNGSQGIVIGFCSHSQCPIVKYNNGVEQLMSRHTWLSEKIPGIGVQQVPLILAWALTIHKSQGATLDAAEIDVGSGIFECGQTYVALSRVKSLDGLFLTSYDVTKIKINRKVKEFYSSTFEKGGAKSVATMC